MEHNVKLFKSETSYARSLAYKDKFSDEYLLESLATCFEAYGYLECLLDYYPDDNVWTEKEQLHLMLIIAVKCDE
jgi:hypothetical protein